MLRTFLFLFLSTMVIFSSWVSTQSQYGSDVVFAHAAMADMSDEPEKCCEDTADHMSSCAACIALVPAATTVRLISDIDGHFRPVSAHWLAGIEPLGPLDPPRAA